MGTSRSAVGRATWGEPHAKKAPLQRRTIVRQHSIRSMPIGSTHESLVEKPRAHTLVDPPRTASNRTSPTTTSIKDGQKKRLFSQEEFGDD